MKTLKCLVKGLVQQVGYRSFVRRMAKRVGVKGYVKNLDDADESVEIMAQHMDEKVLAEFLQKINVKTDLIDVQEIITEEVEGKQFAKFEIVRGSYEEENAERLDEAAYHLDNLTQETRGGFGELKQEMRGGFGELKQETKGGFDTIHNDLINFNNATSQRFDGLDTKYGKVSDKLDRIANSIDKLADLIRRMVPK